MIWVLYATHASIYAQYSQYPAHQSQVFNVIRTYNPAMSNIDGHTEVQLNYQRYLGAFDKVNNKLFFANFNLSPKDSAGSKHNLGLKFSGEDEGEYITRNRFYVSYGWHLRVTQNYWLGAGAYLGLAGYTYSGTSGNTQGFASAPDGDFGLVFYRPEYIVLGFSVNQAFNTTVQPKDLSFRWKRFYNLYIQKHFIWNQQWSTSLYGQENIRTDTYNTTDIGAYMSYRGQLLMGGNLTTATKFSVMAGFQNIPLKWGDFALIFNYNFPFINQRRTNIQSFELSLKYLFKLKKGLYTDL